jgi:hypothetical protein
MFKNEFHICEIKMQNIVNFKGTSYLWIVKNYTQFMKNKFSQSETNNVFCRQD